MEFPTVPHFMRVCTLLLLLLLLKSGVVYSNSDYLIGLGSYDITGPAADVNMMGYANTEQVASGVHLRLRSRAFIVAEPHGNRVVFVNLDACMASQLVTIKVLERLKARYSDLYNENNVAISGIHTHAGPGGYLQYVVYIVTSLGFVRQSFDALVDGIEKSIVKAHENLRPGSIFVNKGELLDAGVNRSPSGYLNNPAAERSKYKYNVDKEMTLLKFVDDEQGPVGSFNWFATHGTSMSRTNSLISGDNKGTAARLMEDWFERKDSVKMNPVGFEDNSIPRRISNIIPSLSDNHHELLELASSFQSPPGRPTSRTLSVARRVRGALSQVDKPRFVSAFCQSNCGDVSPNVLGAFCTDTGLPCDFNHSTCGGKNELCYGRGPGYPDEFESTRIIGERQFRKAVDLFNGASEQIKGKVDYRHTYIDFSKHEVTLSKGGASEVVKTCPAAMGFAFAAGTTDGPGAFDFKQGDDKGNPFWNLVRNLLKTPNKEQINCQQPKPILLDTGEMKLPYDWAPSVLPIQILRVGQFVILSVPGGERQFRKAVDLFNGASEQIKGKVDYRHTYIDFSKHEVTLSKGGASEVVKTCPAAMGFAFAAGTTDGPGAFDFKQGDDKGNPFWNLVRNLLKTPNKEQINCQQPKPILLDTGEMKLPYDWAPSVLPIQILRVGQFVILSVPGEFTTMAGRRLRDAVKAVLSGNNDFGSDIHVVLAGLTNTYSQYVTTYEEYQVQRYEGASTLYGPHTLSAYIQEFKKLANALISDQPVERGPQPPDLLNQQISLLTPVVVDGTPLGVNFGDVSVDVLKNATFKKGEKVSVTFWSACPRNDLMTEGTFALVEFLEGKDSWVPAYDDDDWCLRFIWSRPSKLSSHSKASLEWRIPEDVSPGVYRIKHFGAAKSLLGSIRHFTGSSSAFVVVS
ncbi:hypothetical protein TanjilG_29704 [Lupinus angustifolius]|uniref:Neutral ceramidase n=1 Tax=Lupinus angustifolius TaxID=3871 RepID=A0A4P1R611_LUPAN|nr:hypothetical protein TanjilG_29704 [Lupinus angustifolius]